MRSGCLMGGFRADIVLVGSAAVGAGRSEGLARVQSASEPCLWQSSGKTTYVDQNSVWKVEQVKNGEGVISKCLNGRLTDATNKLRASTVDVIRERQRRNFEQSSMGQWRSSYCRWCASLDAAQRKKKRTKTSKVE
jgi:hypothetical protein